MYESKSIDKLSKIKARIEVKLIFFNFQGTNNELKNQFQIKIAVRETPKSTLNMNTIEDKSIFIQSKDLKSSPFLTKKLQFRGMGRNKSLNWVKASCLMQH